MGELAGARRAGRVLPNGVRKRPEQRPGASLSPRQPHTARWWPPQPRSVAEGYLCAFWCPLALAPIVAGAVRWHAMQPPPSGYVTSSDACRVLGISDRTLRRRVQAGAVDGEYVARPQGTVLYVKLPNGHAAQDTAIEAALDGAAASDQEDTPDGNHAALVAPTAPLEAYLALVADIRILERENGALRAERDAALQAATEAAGRGAELQAELDRLRARPWWRRW